MPTYKVIQVQDMTSRVVTAIQNRTEITSNVLFWIMHPWYFDPYIIILIGWIMFKGLPRLHISKNMYHLLIIDSWIDRNDFLFIRITYKSTSTTNYYILVRSDHVCVCVAHWQNSPCAFLWYYYRHWWHVDHPFTFFIDFSRFLYHILLLLHPN